MSKRTGVLFVCLGNICRSPLGEGIFRHRVEAAGLGDRFEIDSSGTSGWHAGEAPDPGSVRVARARGIDISGQRSRALTREDLERFDVIVAMDASNRRNILSLAGAGGAEALRGRLWLMRNFEREEDGSGDDEGVPDPWGGGARGFEEVFEIVDRSCANLLTWIRRERGMGQGR